MPQLVSTLLSSCQFWIKNYEELQFSGDRRSNLSCYFKEPSCVTQVTIMIIFIHFVKIDSLILFNSIQNINVFFYNHVVSVVSIIRPQNNQEKELIMESCTTPSNQKVSLITLLFTVP